MLDSGNVLESDIAVLSWERELQRFSLAMICVQQADVHMIDELSSHLDVRQ